MKKYYVKKTPKCRQLTLTQIYGLPNNKQAKAERQEIRGDDKTFIESLKEIGRNEKRGESSLDRSEGL